MYDGHPIPDLHRVTEIPDHGCGYCWRWIQLETFSSVEVMDGIFGCERMLQIYMCDALKTNEMHPNLNLSLPDWIRLGRLMLFVFVSTFPWDSTRRNDEDELV